MYSLHKRAKNQGYELKDDLYTCVFKKEADCTCVSHYYDIRRKNFEQNLKSFYIKIQNGVHNRLCI